MTTTISKCNAISMNKQLNDDTNKNVDVLPWTQDGQNNRGEIGKDVKIIT